MQRVIITICALAISAACCQAAMTSPAAVACPMMQQAPTIDGVLGDGEWSDAGMPGPMVIDGGGRPSLDTEVWLGYDATALYIAARMQDPMPLAVQCAATERDGAVMADDSLVVILDPGNDGDSLIELAVNAMGVEYDAIDGNPEPTIAWNSETSVTEDGWVVEIAYLLGADGTPQMGDRWGLNLRRNAPRIGESMSMTGEAGSLGTVIYGRPALRCDIPQIDSPWYGRNTTTVGLRNLSGARQNVKINVRVTGPTRRAHYFGVTKATLEAGASQGVPVTWEVRRGGRCSVEFSVQVVEGTTALTALRTAKMPFELPALGQAFDAAVSEIARAYELYARVPKQNRPFDGATRLDMLLARWRYLDSEQQRRAALEPQDVFALMGRIRELTEDAVLMQREFRELLPQAAG